MKPARMKNRWVKVLPWYYTKRRQPSRHDDIDKAITKDLLADQEGRDA